MAINWTCPNPSDIFDSAWHKARDEDEVRGLQSLKVAKDMHDLHKFLVAGNRNITSIKHQRSVVHFLMNYRNENVYSDDMMVQMILAHARHERYYRAESALRQIKDETFDRLQKMYVVLKALQEYWGEFSGHEQIEQFAVIAAELQKMYDSLGHYIQDQNQERVFWKDRYQEMYDRIKSQVN